MLRDRSLTVRAADVAGRLQRLRAAYEARALAGLRNLSQQQLAHDTRPDRLRFTDRDKLEGLVGMAELRICALSLADVRAHLGQPPRRYPTARRCCVPDSHPHGHRRVSSPQLLPFARPSGTTRGATATPKRSPCLASTPIEDVAEPAARSAVAAPVQRYPRRLLHPRAMTTRQQTIARPSFNPDGR